MVTWRGVGGSRGRRGERGSENRRIDVSCVCLVGECTSSAPLSPNTRLFQLTQYSEVRPAAVVMMAAAETTSVALSLAPGRSFARVALSWLSNSMAVGGRGREWGKSRTTTMRTRMTGGQVCDRCVASASVAPSSLLQHMRHLRDRQADHPCPSSLVRSLIVPRYTQTHLSS